MSCAWYPEWLEIKRKYARTDERFMDRDTFMSLTVGKGFPALEQRSTFAFHSADDGARRFTGESIDGEAPYARVYSRMGNPTTEVLERLLVDLDAHHIVEAAKADGFKGPTMAGQAFSSGMSAIGTTIMSLTEAGDTIILGEVVYGGTVGLMGHLKKRFKLNPVYVDTTDVANLKKALVAHPEAKLVFIETPDNPTLKITDIAAVAKLTEERSIPLVVDNTFATPYLQQPLRLGADIVIQSMTKYISGHSLSIGGCVVGPYCYVRKELFPLAKDLGGCLSPFDAWLDRITVATLGHRLEHQCANAATVASFLAEHKRVKTVTYPGLKSHPHHARAKAQMRLPGAMISFEVEGGIKPAKKLMDFFARPDVPMELAVSLGAVVSYIQHPASMTHAAVPKADREKAGLSDDLIRLSVGIEGASTLVKALDEGLKLAYR